VPARRAGSGRRHRRARAADLPDDVVRVRQRRSRGSLFNLQTFGNVYSRISNPTVAALEERVAALEGGRARSRRAPAWPRRCRAAHAGRNGDHIVARARSTAAPYSQLAVTFAQFGIDDDLRRRRRPENFRARCVPHQGVYVETIGNPQLNVADIAASPRSRTRRRPARRRQHARVALLCRPFEHGADIVVHSVTKYLGGHGTTMGGIVVESGQFPWDNGNFPQMTEPSRGYHGVRFHETFGDFGFTMKARMETMRTLGPDARADVGVPAAAGHRDAASAHAAALRVGAGGRAHLSRIRAWSGSLSGAAGASPRALARKYLPRGAGGILTFGVKRRRARPASASSRPCRSCRTSPTSATRNAGHPSRRRRRTGSSTRTSSAPPASRPNDPPVGRPRVARRHPVGPRPGLDENVSP
jgi:O-acetylhomoserine (thiol)-lyase